MNLLKPHVSHFTNAVPENYFDIIDSAYHCIHKYKKEDVLWLEMRQLSTIDKITQILTAIIMGHRSATEINCCNCCPSLVTTIYINNTPDNDTFVLRKICNLIR